MDPSIGLTSQQRADISLALSKILADEFLLQTKTRNAHWNVEGRDFHSKHVFFEAQYRELENWIDEIAERIRSLGHYAPASLKTFLQLTHFDEEGLANNSAEEYIKELLTDHESLIVHLRASIASVAADLHDVSASDFMTGLMEAHEKMAWMLRAHL